MTITDITIVPVPVGRKDDYIAFSRRMAEVYRDHGAVRITDYWQVADAGGQEDFHADGLVYGEGELPDFADVIGAAASEAIVVTLTEWPSREARDRGAAAATSDPRVLATLEEDPVFDGSRVIASSFEIAMSLRR
ncbi:DUF1428 domain-containing protein [Modestobacter italicus]|uniref:DUF1428 domain-containing protein n=1 Tax=Modestobacter italicus (strain DSM 44449 / CECT 9708 / BC 501) TaxID=2732864 RepID=UPI001C96189F|nr:DUF1428 family protein [Modestobacter italicus]